MKWTIDGFLGGLSKRQRPLRDLCAFDPQVSQVDGDLVP
jgi:hypothetical protein